MNRFNFVKMFYGSSILLVPLFAVVDPVSAADSQGEVGSVYPIARGEGDKELLYRVAHHNIFCPIISRQTMAFASQDDYNRTLRQYIHIQDHLILFPEAGQDDQFLLITASLACCYAVSPELRPQIERVLMDGARLGSCRELLMYFVLRAGILSDENKKLAERLFSQIPFSLKAFKAQIAALYVGNDSFRNSCRESGEKGRMQVGQKSFCPQALYGHAQEELARACVDADAKEILFRLVRQEVITESVAENVLKEYLSLDPSHSGTYEEISEGMFWTSNFRFLWPSQLYIQTRRIKLGLTGDWNLKRLNH